MNKMLTVFAVLLGATLFFNLSMNFMANNIADFETVALPPKKLKKKAPSLYPVIKIDATSRSSWTMVDFSTGKTFNVESPEKSKKKLKKLKWDLGFQRTKVISNSGATNPEGNTKITNLGKVDFGNVQEIPETGYVIDTVAWGNITNKAISSWYNYRTRTHNVESNKHVYILKNDDGGHSKIRIINYYCSKEEKDCSQTMCGREEAACLSIEHVYLPPGNSSFPPPVIPSDMDKSTETTS
ncbi:MAG: HmuY family protein [Nitrospinales bacterium]